MQGEVFSRQVTVSPSSSLNPSGAMFGEIGTRGPTTWQVRRVEQYIETHWDQPITIEILARATAARRPQHFLSFQDLPWTIPDVVPQTAPPATRQGDA